eukprot:Blabericola_migrator_1__4114@NODE_2252_length_3051_cov_1329_759048_g1419_i0_p3_GENE_NODE_2252_length_3051_cov_1329_759048_g1419_i0NODE_2252_length_3051_cov_1329_759048_g1419_i0_p3_ORF_typecomplete_len129_score8_55_NODE_2252_length_3051_cov_1329_759048_g1419_i025972983
MSVVLKAPPAQLQRYDVSWETSVADMPTHSKCPLRNISQISECVWASSKIIYDEDDDNDVAAQQKYIPVSAAAKRRMKLYYCQMKERFGHHRSSNQPHMRGCLTEKLAQALSGFTHSPFVAATAQSHY